MFGVEKDTTTDLLSRLDAAGNRVAASLVNESNVVDGQTYEE